LAERLPDGAGAVARENLRPRRTRRVGLLDLAGARRARRDVHRAHAVHDVGWLGVARIGLRQIPAADAARRQNGPGESERENRHATAHQLAAVRTTRTPHTAP